LVNGMVNITAQAAWSRSDVVGRYASRRDAYCVARCRSPRRTSTCRR
jgi:hypothetical protein